MVQLLDMVDKLTSRLQTYFRLVFVIGQPEQATSSQSEAPSKFFCRHLRRPLQHMTPQLHLIFMTLKWKPVAMGMRAPRAPVRH